MVSIFLTCCVVGFLQPNKTCVLSYNCILHKAAAQFVVIASIKVTVNVSSFVSIVLDMFL